MHKASLPSCVEVGHAAFESIFSKEYKAARVRDGHATSLLLAIIFIVHRKPNAITKETHVVKGFLQSCWTVNAS